MPDWKTVSENNILVICWWFFFLQSTLVCVFFLVHFLFNFQDSNYLNYSGDLDNKHLNHGNIWIVDFYKSGIQIISYSDARFLLLDGQENVDKLSGIQIPMFQYLYTCVIPWLATVSNIRQPRRFVSFLRFKEHI